FTEASFCLSGSDLLLIPRKFQRIEGGKLFIVFDEAAAVNRQFQPFLTGDAGMVGAARADLQPGVELLHKNHIAAAGTFEQQILRNFGAMGSLSLPVGIAAGSV